MDRRVVYCNHKGEFPERRVDSNSPRIFSAGEREKSMGAAGT